MHLKTQSHQGSFMFIALRRPAALDSLGFLLLIRTKVSKESVEKWGAKNFRTLILLIIFRPSFFDGNLVKSEQARQFRDSQNRIRQLSPLQIISTDFRRTARKAFRSEVATSLPTHATWPGAPQAIDPANSSLQVGFGLPRLSTTKI